MWNMQLVSIDLAVRTSPVEVFDTYDSIFESVRKTYPVIRFVINTEIGSLWEAFHEQIPGKVYFEIWGG